MKERLTGAIILVALIVLLVPELLSGPVRAPASAAPATADAIEEAPVRTVKIDIPDDHLRPVAPEAPPVPGNAPHPMAAAEPAAPAPVINPPGAANAAPPASDTSAASAPAPPHDAPAQAHAPTQEPRTGRSEPHTRQKSAWVVQLGSFASRDNAERLAAKLRSQGFKASVTAASGKGHSLWRVRAGVPGDRAAAEQLAGKVRAAGHSVSIVAK